MTAEPQDPNWSHRLPDRGPGELGPIGDDGGPVFAFYMTAVRVEVDPRSEEVIEVIVDEGPMGQPTMVTRLDGSIISGADRDRVSAVFSRAEWPTGDYGTVGHGPVVDGTEQ